MKLPKRQPITVDDPNKGTQKIFTFSRDDAKFLIEPTTTGLSPYMNYGCLSPRRFWTEAGKLWFQKKKTLPKTLHSETPKKLDQGKTVSIRGQLMYREFFYTVASSVNNFTKMEGNRICRQIDWYENEEQKTAWREGRTGYPWIDAIIRQMILEGN